MPVKTPTASIVVVGNEVLSAKIEDANGPWLLRRLRELGVRVRAVVTVPDELDAVVEAVARERRRSDWVFTSGGIGPTHDDLTVPAVARALGRRVVRDETFAEAIKESHRRHFGGEAPGAALRMADVPEGTRLVGEGFPLLQCENVVMLPGVPQFLRWQFDRFAPALQAAPFHLACVYVSVGENEIAPALDAVALAHPRVDIGSYPRFDGADHKVKLTFEAKEEELVDAAVKAFLGSVEAGWIVRCEGVAGGP